eukprot:TRINITY_DN5980_c0_g1_i1.p2 TRINITY_DN5980_c0_g1~~TRINITY_DN5980_c0_g1_i1.p2  ORF type:complete len:322 (+),score=97.67 TRINITY_DN5980_c0_g1_i1:74-967(+)
MALLLAAAAAASAGGSAVDATWLQFLNSPPPAAVQTAAALSQRAERLAAGLPRALNVSGDVDVVISGGGNFDAYYIGVHGVFSRAAGLRPRRWAGASAGGMMPFEFVLKGERATVETHFAYGELCAMYPREFDNMVAAVYLQDHHWRLMAAWQTPKYAGGLGRLNGTVCLALSCLAPLPELVRVCNFTAAGEQATRAFMATGTPFQMYEGMPCSDGGAMSGPLMAPLFQDGRRPQIIVNLMATGFPKSMVMAPVNSAQYRALAEKGQDDAVNFLRGGASAAISLCSKGAATPRNTCG